MARPPNVDDVFRAVAHPARRRMLDLLRGGERPAGSLAAPFRMSAPAVTQHLRVLLRAGLVSRRRQGQQRIYSLEPKRLREVADWANQFQKVGKSKKATRRR